MPVRMKNVPSNGLPLEEITLLVLTPDEADVTAVRQVFRHPAWRVEHRETVSEALPLLSRAAVVLCEWKLADGGWQEVLSALNLYTDAPALIVTSRHADGLLWAEVLNLGGYDVLPKPFENKEIMRVVNMARRHRQSMPAGRQTDLPRQIAVSA